MGDIEDVVAEFIVQTAVYWGPGTNDGYGSKVWPDPVEVLCRWTDKTEIVQSDNGEEAVSSANALVNDDLEYEGYMFLGTLDDLDSSEEDNPMTVDGAWRIIRWQKVPMVFETDDFVRTAYLGSGSQI